VNTLKTLCCCLCLIAADQLAEKWQKRIADANSNYATAVAKADNTRFYAVQKANSDRLNVLKKVLSEATKAGDFVAASKLKKQVDAAASDGVSRPKPKNVIKFGGHEYALIEDKVTWHVAKRRCEEMGGHLVIPETVEEQAGVTKLCASNTVWCGASDEETEGQWQFINGDPVPVEQQKTWSIDNENGFEHHLFFYPTNGRYMDGSASTRFFFICEWSK